MTTIPSLHQQKTNWGLLFAMLCLLVLWGALFYHHKMTQRKAIKTLMSIHSREVTSFRVHPDKTYTENYHNAIEFAPKNDLVTAFFGAITDSRPYQPEHDQALAQWGMQIRTETTTVRIGCYIPDLKPKVAVGRIDTNSGSGHFQSQSLLRWYQKYGHYWRIGGYQKVQYSRVKPILKSISPKKVTSFRIVPGVSESSTDKETDEFNQDAELVTKFFQALEDMQFAAPMHRKLVDQWGIQIHTGTTTLNIECSIPAEEPTVVVGLIDSDAGYSYFQSRKLFEWYQTYSHRWLEASSK